MGDSLRLLRVLGVSAVSLLPGCSPRRRGGCQGCAEKTKYGTTAPCSINPETLYANLEAAADDGTCLEPFTVFDLRFTEMNTSTRKTIAAVSLGFTIIWFAAILLFESRYLFSVLRQQRAFRDALGTIYEEQIEGINFIILFVYLVPGLFAWVMYWRFKKEY
jgi:hypothetical protein